MWKIFTIVSICCLGYLLGFSQPYYFKHYQVEDGLSNNAVICSMQDSKGFMWFGTRDGLNRFDGYTFKVFRHNTQDTSSIGHNFIQSLHEDSSGKIWAGTDFGIFIYDPLTESFCHFAEDRDAVIVNIRSDDQGNIWYTANYRTLVRYNEASGELKRFENLGMSSIETLSISPKGLWLGSNSGELKLLDPKTEAMASFDVFSKSPQTRSKVISSLLWDEQQNALWVGTSKQGIKVLFPDQSTYQDLLRTSDGQEVFVRDIKKMDADQYWFATESGVFIYARKKGTFTKLKKQDNNKWSLSDNADYTLCRDREGGVWIGSWFGGVSYYHKQHTFFEKFFPLNTDESLSGSAVREICEDTQGNLWVGTENGGLNKLTAQGEVIQHFKPNGQSSSLSGLNIHALLLTGDTLWVGTFHQGLNLLSVSTGKVFRHYYANKESGLNSNFIYTMLRTRKGEIFVATDLGIYQYLFDQKRFQLVKALPPYIFYTSVFEDHEGTIWVGSWRDGLYFYNPKTSKQGVYYYSQKDKNSLPSNRITNIMETSDHQLWVATEEGVCWLDKAKNRFVRLELQQGMPGQGILACAFLEDQSKNLWISTSKGLIRYHLKTGYTRKFTLANGLLSDQFNYNSAYKAKDGTFYFGSVKGLIRFKPDQLQEKKFTPPVYITGFQVYDHELEINGKGSPLKKSISFTDSIVLRHDQSSFSIDFAALSYLSPEMTEYTYKMEGLDPNWTYLQTNRKAYFTELSPGDYAFKVSAINGGGKLMGKEAILYIQILPPFWASKTAYILYLLLIGILVYFGIRTYHRRLKERNRRKLEQLAHRKEEEMYQAKIEFFTQVAHEIRTPLTLIKGPMEKIIKQVEEVPTIRKNLLIMEKNTERLLQLSGQLLDFRKTEVQGFSLTYQKLDMIRLLKDHIERSRPTAEESNIKIKLYLSKEPIGAFVDVEAMDKIISNLFNNALKYASKKIEIHLCQQSEDIRIMIASDGPLIPVTLKEKIFQPFFRIPGNSRTLGSGLGLALARSLAEKHGGQLILDVTVKENFNTFVLTLPINQKETE